MPKVIKTQDVMSMLSNMPEEKVFWCNDGRIFRNMRDMGDGLSSMTEETYGYHAHADKNDFANWVRDVIRDGDLAKNISKATNRTQAAKVVADRVSLLERKSKIVK